MCPVLVSSRDIFEALCLKEIKLRLNDTHGLFILIILKILSVFALYPLRPLEFRSPYALDPRSS